MTINNTIQNIADFLTNREWAIVIWALILLIYFLRRKTIGISITNVIRDFFAKKIVITNCLTISLISFFCWILSLFNIWDISMLKDTMLYSAWSFAAIMHILDDKNLIPFKDITTKHIKINAVLITIINFYSFSLLAELILVPTIFYIMQLEKFSRYKQEDKDANKVLKVVQVIIFICLFGVCIYKIIQDPKSFFSKNFVSGLILPISLTLLMIPYYYLLSLYAVYEQCFIILECMSIGDKKEYRFRRNTLIKVCGFNLKKLKHVKSDWRPGLCDTSDKFVKELQTICNYKRLNYYDECNNY